VLATLTIVGLVSILILELWRRTIAKRTPRWITNSVVASYVALVGGIAFAWWGVIHAFGGVATTEASEKASMLSNGISQALTGAAIGLACALVAAVLLAIVTLRR
jgi:hypothetical protein